MARRLIPDKVEYVLSEKLGEGLNSEVYLASRREPRSGIQQTIALKWFKSLELAENWKFEFQQLCQFNSSYCVQVMGWDWIQGRPGLLLEYIDGINLDRLSIGEPLPLYDVDFICSQVQEGLKDLHEGGFCHGDLNPGNIMISPEGQIKLIDFGLKDLKAEKIFVSPAFCDPNVLQGRKPDLGSDLYSLACIRDFLLAGQEKGRKGGKGEEAGEEAAFSRRWKQSRKCVDFKVGPPSKNLKRRIHEKLKSRQASTTYHTRVYTTWKPASGPWQLMKHFILIVSAMALFPFSGESFSSPPSGFLSLRSHFWVKVELDGKSLGYSPIVLQVLPAGKRQLKLQGAQGSFQKDIKIQQGKLLLLSSKQFKIWKSKSEGASK